MLLSACTVVSCPPCGFCALDIALAALLASLPVPQSGPVWSRKARIWLATAP
jgi:hypothetical protein